MLNLGILAAGGIARKMAKTITSVDCGVDVYKRQGCAQTACPPALRMASTASALVRFAAESRAE